MNVKNQIFEKENKQNIIGNMSSQSYSSINKHRANIGQQIRKKLKIAGNIQNNGNILMPRDQNVNVDNKFTKEHKKTVERVHYMQRSIQVSHQSSRSIKSVRFNDSIDEVKLNRKHSNSSILKNTKASKKPRFSDKMSINNSVCSNILKDDQSTQNISYNKISKQKFQRILQGLKKTDKKYIDELFPQVWSSLSRMQQPAFKQIKWMRLSQIYQGKYLTVWDSNQQVKVLPSKFSLNNLFPNCFNSIKHNKFILQKMFESQAYNKYGIYYVKINQNNTWKYIVVDDYIPVYKDEKNDKKFYPAFLNVHSSNHNHMQLWPFLLQKAYAKHFSNYECLDLSNQIDFMHEITGCYPEEKDPNTIDYQQICNEVNNYDSILIGKDYANMYYPIVPRKPALTCQNSQKEYVCQQFTSQEFKKNFIKVYCILLHKHFYSGFCTIKYNSNKSDTNNHKSIRTIKVQQPTHSVFSLIQKDSRHLYLSYYRYVWVRMIVVMKESDQNYRWVGGIYSNNKYCNLSLWLEPAQYLVFVIPQWKNKGYDLNLTFQGNVVVNIDRKPYIGNQNILIQAAMDLAQSKGRLKQLNQNICTYSFIDRKVGLIIQNINNQRPNGSVRILRSIQGLQKCGDNLIKAYNKQFMFAHTIQVKIQSLQHYTVLLAVQGGLNQGFLDQFDFGS